MIASLPMRTAFLTSLLVAPLRGEGSGVGDFGNYRRSTS